MSIAEDIQNAIANINDQESFIQKLLIDALHWEIDPSVQDLEETAYEYTADELNSPLLDDKCNGRALQLVFQSEIPWGVFLIEFAHEEPFVQARGLTMPLRQLLNGLVPKQRRDSQLPAWDRENLLFICTHDYRHFRFAYFQAAAGKEKTSPLKLFGWNEGDTAVRTLCEHNLRYLEWDHTNWAEAFDVEKVTKDFYHKYADLFHRMRDAIGEHNEISGDDLQLFTQMLFNRLMFLRFIERKGWLKFGDTPDYLANLYAAGGIGGRSFYQSRLVPLFFEGLAVEGEQQSDIIGKVPFLNGGLFEKADLDHSVKDIPDDVFDDVLGPQGLFYSYNFTISESTPLNIEVAVDPEMLGRIFERLVTGRHESGSYYTPRPVVAFMCQEALKGYLNERTDVTEDAIALLVEQHDAGGILEGQTETLEAALGAIKACDPACGSGAYLLGLMQELIAIRRALQSEKLRADPEFLYKLKLHIISHNLYGVDIDPFATNIAMLRLWLSLSVDADAPEPLPNLDFKIETGDSLLGPCREFQKDFSAYLLERRAEHLVENKDEYLRAHGCKKQQLYEHIRREEDEIAEECRIRHGKGVIAWPVHFAEVFFGDTAKMEATFDGKFGFAADQDKQKGLKQVIGSTVGGFDIVLTNPPYVRQELISSLKPQLKAGFPEVYAGTADLYVYFYARAVQLLQEGGVLSFIAPNKFFRAGYGKKLRTHLVARTELLDLLDFGDYPIFQSITYPSIIVAQKRAEVSADWHVRALNWPDSLALAGMSEAVESKSEKMLQRDLSAETWQIMDLGVGELVRRLRTMGNPLGELLSGGLFYGIKTGRNEVFEIDETTRAALIEQDENSGQIIRPWLRGRNVARWTVNWDAKYLVFTRRGIDIDTYPAVKEYLARHRERLEPRPPNLPAKGWKGRKPGSYKWFEVQDAIDYWREFDKPKIVYQVIATYQQFAYTAEPFVSNDKTWIIPDPPDGLLGLLNSKVVWFFLDQITPKLQGGAFELRSPYMSQIPVPELSGDLVDRTNRILELASSDETDEKELWQLEHEIDEIVAGLYSLTTEEERIINEAVEVAGNRFPRRCRESRAYKDYVAEMFGED